MRLQLNPKAAVSIIYVSAMFIAAMDATIVNVALAAIGRDFHIPPTATNGINAGYLVGIAVFLPMAGWLGDRFGAKRIFLTALGMFTLASGLCGVANQLAILNWFRVIQGVGGGLLTPTGMAMLFRTFAPEERVKVSRSLIFPIAVAPALGPIIGGFLVQHLSWRWVFLINLPFGALVLLFSLLFLVEHKEPAAGRLDLPGVLLSAPGFAMLMYALIHGPSQGWGSFLILGTGFCGAVLLGALVRVELRVKEPLLDLRLLADRVFQRMSIIAALTAAGLVGMLFIFPLMYQNMLGASPLESGLTTFPEALGLIIASRIMPRTYRRLGARWVVSLGLGGAIPVFLLLSMVGPTTDPWSIRVLFFCMGLCLGHTVVAAQFLAFHHISAASMGRATTLFNVQNRIGSALGVVVLASLLGGFGTRALGATGTGQPIFEAYRFALRGSVVFLLAALFVGLGIRKTEA
jgi:EmrB/QacA subfamily drug resistance transporter